MRRCAEFLFEEAGKMALVAKTVIQRNFGQGFIGFDEFAPGPLQANLTQIIADRRLAIFTKALGQMNRMNPDECGNLG